jgi:hypothetical protein
MNALIVSPAKPQPNRKFTDEQLVEVHSKGLSTPKVAEQLGVSRQSVCKRLKKIGLEANFKPGGVTRYEKAGSEHFCCSSCGRDKPLRQRHGTSCNKCHDAQRINTTEKALRHRYNKKKSYAKQSGIPFTLTFEEYKRQYAEQDGRDGYTGEQMSFDFGHGLSRATVTLDRIDNDRGYTHGNVMFCCMATNAKKGNRPVRRLIEQLKLDLSIEVSDGSEPESREVS